MSRKTVTAASKASWAVVPSASVTSLDVTLYIDILRMMALPSLV